MKLRFILDKNFKIMLKLLVLAIILVSNGNLKLFKACLELIIFRLYYKSFIN